ncbi:cytosolic phospholipase A2 gamma-like isoform X2 [Aquarana catesbeiana]|uniref:cytosolic phospholipase A2 gamma-like isoform X2 n=1 Tax=Aquarana catesbeiana TaxID=8400 RepID=UPI003CCA0E0B
MAANKENTDIVDGSEGETKSVNARKIKVKKTLSSLDMNVTESCDPPVIAVLGSGGGLRAMVGLMGTISKLAELNILGAATYMAGISGSTWCISSLYSKKNWSDFSVIKDLENQLRERIKQETQRKHPWEKIKEKFLEELYSLTDLWAYTFVFEALNTVNKGKLSSHKEMCETGEDPYPVYSAVRKSLIHENKSEAWFEFTPHTSGFPAYKCYIKTENLGSEFKGGCLLKKQPEPDLIYLQGLWGSAPGADWIKLFIHDMYCKFIQWLTGEMSKDLQLQGFWWSDIIRVMKNIGFCLLEWEWGTTNNFLYQCKDKIPEDCDLFQKKYIHLIDAGLEINTPYPLVLHPHRKVDLIMSFDFSQDGPFETVKKTAEYCKEHKIPFPEINEESFEDPPTKSCYIFKGDGNETPDVMHFPLFNTQTCGDAEKIKESIIEYDTKVLLYDGPKIDTLLNITKKNVESSLKQILDQIKECVQRCNKKGMS